MPSRNPGFLIVILILTCCNSLDKNERKKNLIDNNDSIKISTNKASEYNQDQINFLKELPPGSELFYESIADSDTNILKITHIGTFLVRFDFITKTNHSRLKQIADTLELVPSATSHISLRYNYHCPAWVFHKTNEDAEYFISKDLNYAFRAYRDTKNSIRDILPLKRRGAEEPYVEYLKAVMDAIGEYSLNLRERNNDESRIIDEHEYSKNYVDFIKLLEEIKKKNLLTKITNDPTLLDKAKWYDIDSLCTLLRKYGFKDRRGIDWNTKQVIIKEDFYKLRGLLYRNRFGEILSNRFEKFYFEQSSDYKFDIDGLDEFITEKEYSSPLRFNGLYISVLRNEGLNIITVWKMKKNYYTLESILDKSFYESYGGFQIDTIYPLDVNRNVIIGKSEGGDQGDNWGTIWIAVWEMPRNLKVVLRQGWSVNYNEDYPYLDYSFKSDSIIQIEMKRIQHKEIKGNYTKIESTITTYDILLDTLYDNEHISITKYLGGD